MGRTYDVVDGIVLGPYAVELSGMELLWVAALWLGRGGSVALPYALAPRCAALFFSWPGMLPGTAGSVLASFLRARRDAHV